MNPRALCWLGFCAATAHAQTPPSEQEKLDALIRPQSQIEIGAGAARGNTFLGGNFNGLRPGFGIVHFDWRGKQMRWGNPEDDHFRWRVEGRDLGLDARSLAAEWGTLNQYRMSATQDRIVKRASDSYLTPYEGVGTSRLTLPAGFVRGDNPAGMTRLAEALRAIPVESIRERNVLSASWWPDADWELTAQWRHEAVDGTKIRGLEFGSAPQIGRSTPLLEPIKTVTQMVDLAAAYTGESERFSVGYHASLFDNQAAPLEWQSAYTSAPFTGGATGLASGFPLDTGRAGRLPNNRFQRVDAQGVFDFSNATRLTLNLRRGRATQNEAFLPYTVNTGLTALALPRSALDGVIDTTFALARLSLRPVRGFHLTSTLKFDERDNRTPLAEYIYVGGDAQLQPAAGASSDRIRTNLPRSRRQTQASVEGDWRFASTMAIKGAWNFDSTARTHAEVDTAREHTIKLDFRHVGNSPWMVNAGLSAAMRRGSTYQANAPFLATYTSPAFIESLLRLANCMVPLDCVRAGPLQTKFFLADRDRGSARLIVFRNPGGPWSWLVRAERTLDLYPNSAFGREHQGRTSLNGELTWQPDAALAASAFVTQDRQSLGQITRQVGVGSPAVASDADWTHRARDRTLTVGSTMKWRGLGGGRLAFDASMLAVRGRTLDETVAGRAAPASQNPSAALPATRYRMSEARIGATWQADRVTQWKLRASHRSVTHTDWAYANVSATTLSNWIGTLERSPDFDTRVVRVSWVRVFR
ncbi:MAG: MtrB/PioB family decaheme-associated outer membrane protein [Betaproteobacteria bacterium]|nr:MtrB/PioB family decaheme-associated outer membrane protein [Betaproteobacteria bacterium]